VDKSSQSKGEPHMVSLGLLVLRIVVGGLFAIHGYTKVFGGEGKGSQVSPDAERLLGKGFTQHMEQGGITSTTGFMTSLGLPNPRAAAIALMVTELGGGLALILGWKTRMAALALTFSQLVAIQKVHAPNGLIAEGGYENNVALAAATAALAIAGPGALSAD